MANLVWSIKCRALKHLCTNDVLRCTYEFLHVHASLLRSLAAYRLHPLCALGSVDAGGAIVGVLHFEVGLGGSLERGNRF